MYTADVFSHSWLTVHLPEDTFCRQLFFVSVERSSLVSVFRRVLLCQGPGDGRPCHAVEAFLSLFPAGLAPGLLLTGARWGESHVLQAALAGQLPPFPTFRSNPIVTSPCAGVTVGLSLGQCCPALMAVAGQALWPAVEVLHAGSSSRCLPSLALGALTQR